MEKMATTNKVKAMVSGDKSTYTCTCSCPNYTS